MGSNSVGSPVPTRLAKEKHDSFVMETNDSSIVSKSSVEQIYFTDEPHFFRYFVKDLRRRSPLINRGYWLRMRAIEHVICKFMNEDSCRKKVLVNLGCGFDPLPFRYLATCDSEDGRPIFVDVDYPKLMRQKRNVIVNTDPLCDLLNGLDTCAPTDEIVIRSDNYLAVGCDLRNPEQLGALLERELGLSSCSILFVAEVSLTYMDIDDADNVIRWAASFKDARFCLLEQHLPDGPGHPFAETMLKHFEKLHSPLRSVHRYPRLRDQEMRFADRGWHDARATDLWELWKLPHVISKPTRALINAIEPFDEWEEFILFAGHYFLLTASTHKNSQPQVHHQNLHPVPRVDLESHRASMVCRQYAQGHGCRRFGAALPLQQQESEIPALIGFHGGIGTNGRMTTCDVYSHLNLSNLFEGPPTKALVNHTITPFEDSSCLFVGGRSSPREASELTWLKTEKGWEQMDDLRPGRYRHCAVPVRGKLSDGRKRSSGVLVFGGKTSYGKVLGDWSFWDAERSWQTLPVDAVKRKLVPQPRFGASMIAGKKVNPSGYLTGGMTEDGLVIADLWKWEMRFENGHLKIYCQNLTPMLEQSYGRSILNLFGRFGASLVRSAWGMLLIGGVSSSSVVKQEDEILEFDEKADGITLSRIKVDTDGPRPLLIGCGAVAMDRGAILIVGGGANCFSFGTFWNRGCYALISSPDRDASPWHLENRPSLPPNRALPSPRVDLTDEPNMTSGASRPANETQSVNGTNFLNGTKHSSSNPAPAPSNPAQSSTTPSPASSLAPKPTTVPRVRIATAKDFDALVAAGEPAIIEGLDIGPCVSRWTSSYLKAAVGAERPVVVHAARDTQMSFRAKNFRYETQGFGAFLDAAASGARVYLRSLAASKPAAQPAQLACDFPGLAGDFTLPAALGRAGAAAHSTPLRIAGRVGIWLHYDVLANVYAQVRGAKTLRLFAPADVAHLAFAPGASSSDADPFAPAPAHAAALARAAPRDAHLRPGDLLFVPPLWPHAACAPDPPGFSVAVNVFWRSLSPEAYAAGRDVYGNRDLAAYERGRRDVQRIARSFDGVPRDVRRFYIKRLLGELEGLMGE